MATYNLKRFTQPEALREIHPDYLLRFLGTHRDYFESRGVRIPAPGGLDEMDYEGLAKVFMVPDANTPVELAEALYLVHEMATEMGMDLLLEEVERRHLSLDGGQDLTPADVAIQVWLQDPDALERKHAEQVIARRSAFDYFLSDGEGSEKEKYLNEPPSPEVLAALQDDFDAWFESKRRGRGSRVFVYVNGKQLWFSVRHGLSYRREPSLKGGEPATVFYRPAKYDVVIFDPAFGELGMNAGSKGDKELYRKKFGLHLCANEDFFHKTGKYTLKPLQEYGADSLVCSDVEGLEWVVLREVRFYWGGPYHEVETRTADDLFAAFEARDHKLPKGPMVMAKFEVKFEGSKRTRMVTIRPPDKARYVRDSDAEVLERWLTLRGFICPGPLGAAGQPEHRRRGCIALRSRLQAGRRGGPVPLGREGPDHLP